MRYWFLCLLSFLALWFPSPGYAQFGLDIALTVPVEGEGVVDGSIVSLSEGKYGFSSQPYDWRSVGVVEMDAAIELQTQHEGSVYPIASRGHAEVLVNMEGGEIVPGDFVTTSSTPGVGMKAGRDGFLVGQALETFAGSDAETGKILVALQFNSTGIGPGIFNQEPLEEGDALSKVIEDSLSDIFRFTADATYEQPNIFYRYLMAAIVLLITVLLGYFGFARVAQRGVEAIGRNPLAKNAIMVGIIFNVGIAGIIIFAGVVVAYYIIRL